MDLGSHLLSGIALSLIIPTTTIEEKVLIVAGSVMSDIPFSPFYMSLIKKSGKKINDLTEEDFVKYAPEIKFWRKIYQFCHGLPFLILVCLIDLLLFSMPLISIGLALHIIYDLPTHHYDKEELNPKPLYPLSSWIWKWGFTNGWKWKGLKTRAASWAIHLVIIGLIITINTYL